jgi:hypothetical protein
MDLSLSIRPGLDGLGLVGAGLAAWVPAAGLVGDCAEVWAASGCTAAADETLGMFGAAGPLIAVRLR